MNPLDEFNDLAGSIQVAIGIALIAMLALLIYTLAQWWNTPENRLSLLPKWGWLPIILLSQPLGPIAFLLLGRKPEQAAEPAATAETESDVDLVNLLYGDKKKEENR